MKKRSQFLLLIGVIVASATVTAAEIPDEPLNLSVVLMFADTPHPSLSEAESDLESARVISDFHNSANQLNLEAILYPQRVDRAMPGSSNSLGDGSATLRLSHPIYDFGRRSADRSVANVEVQRSQHHLDYVLAQRRIEIMRRFFDVLIADLTYSVQDEKMTLSFLRFDRFLEEMEMFEAHAEVDVLKLETIYREEFAKRQEYSFNRIETRRHLALAMGFTDYVPRDLQMPDLSKYVEREVPEFESLLEQILATNYDLKQAELNLEKALNAAEVSEAKFMPQLDIVLEATEWEQEVGSRNSASIGLRLHVPLAERSQKNRDRRLSQIAVDRARAKLAETEHAVRKRSFELWKALTVYHLDISTAEVSLNYRDQYMDRARTLYELEEISDLGDAQAELLRASLEDYRAKFNLALIWSEIDALTGNQVHPY